MGLLKNSTQMSIVNLIDALRVLYDEAHDLALGEEFLNRMEMSILCLLEIQARATAVVKPEPEPEPQPKKKRPHYNHYVWPSPRPQLVAKAEGGGRLTYEKALEYLANRSGHSVEVFLDTVTPVLYAEKYALGSIKTLVKRFGYHTHW